MESCRADQEAIFVEDARGETGFLTRTKHSLTRCRQRGIKETDLYFIVLWGSRIRRPGRVYEYFISKKDRESIIRDLRYRGNTKYHIQKLDKLVGKAVIVDEDQAVIITAYHRSY